MEPSSASHSIRTRLIVANLLLLPLFLGLVFWILDRAFASYQVDSLRERLRLQNLLLAKAADWDGSQWRLDSLDEPRLGLGDSGLYAFVLASGSEVWWQSPSAQQMGNLAQPLDAISFIVTIIAGIPNGLAVAFKSQNMGSYPVQKPAIV